MRHAMPIEGGRWRRRVLIAVSIFVACAVVVAGFVFFQMQRAIDSATGGKGGSAAGILVPQPLNGEDGDRVSILIAGNSFDDAGHDGADLTDSIMVATFDLTTDQLSLISIPRDLWVEYDGKRSKINEVYLRGGLTGLGEVVEEITGLPISQHLLVGYTALKDAVDAVGGIDIDLEATDERGIWDPNTGLRLPNGPQHIDGQTALDLTRSRNHPMPGEKPYGISDGDFGRGRNQRMVLAALLTKVKTTPALANPLAIAKIFGTLSRNVETDLSIGQIRRIFDLTTGENNPPVITCSITGDGVKALLVDYRKTSVWALAPAAGLFQYDDIQAYLHENCLG